MPKLFLQQKSVFANIPRIQFCFGSVLLLSVFLFSGCVSVPRPPQAPLVGGVYHIVDSGQTLYRIAQVYNVDLKEIMRVNNIIDPRQLGVGQELFIPGAL